MHVNERRRRRLTHKGHGGKERRDASFLPAKGLPRGTGAAKRIDSKVIIGRVP